MLPERSCIYFSLVQTAAVTKILSCNHHSRREVAYLARKLSSRVCWRCLHCVSERIMSVPDKIAQELAGLHDDGELADGEAASFFCNVFGKYPAGTLCNSIYLSSYFRLLREKIFLGQKSRTGRAVISRIMFLSLRQESRVLSLLYTKLPLPSTWDIPGWKRREGGTSRSPGYPRKTMKASTLLRPLRERHGPGEQHRERLAPTQADSLCSSCTSGPGSAALWLPRGNSVSVAVHLPF